MAELKTQQNEANVTEFIESYANTDQKSKTALNLWK